MTDEITIYMGMYKFECDKDKAIYVRAYADNFFRTVGAQIRNDSFHAKAFLAKCQALYDDADILDPSGAIK